MGEAADFPRAASNPLLPGNPLGAVVVLPLSFLPYCPTVLLSYCLTVLLLVYLRHHGLVREAPSLRKAPIYLSVVD